MASEIIVPFLQDEALTEGVENLMSGICFNQASTIFTRLKMPFELIEAAYGDLLVKYGRGELSQTEKDNFREIICELVKDGPPESKLREKLEKLI